jgi:hypothetical protein
MKHVKMVSREPKVAQTPTLEVKFEFLNTAITQVFAFVAARNGGAIPKDS